MKKIEKAKTIVVKIGTQVLMGKKGIDRRLVNNLASEVSSLQKKGHKFVIVTSGAVGMGLERLGKKKANSLSMQQASAAIGQSRLMGAYDKAFEKHRQPIAQILLSSYTFENKVMAKNLGATVKELMKLNVIPIINENDAVSTAELSTAKGFSDNDTLAALVAKNFSADLLVVFTNVDGLYSDDPVKNPDARKITEVRGVGNVMKYACGGKSAFGRGGFGSKLCAIGFVNRKGIPAVVCRPGKNIIKDILKGKEIGTRFI